MRSKILLCLLLVSSLSFVSCSSGDDSPNNSSAQFKDKWWYSPDNSTLDLYFNSNGTYHSVYLFGGATVTSDGEWEWVNESAKTFRVFNLQGNLTDEFYGKATELTDDAVKIKLSFDAGATYSDPYPYIDTND